MASAKKIAQTITILLIGVSLGYGFAGVARSWEDNPEEQARVIGVGGIFFKTPDPAATRTWYKEHMGFKTDQYGTLFEWDTGDSTKRKEYLQWSAFGNKSTYFEDDYMINYRVVGLKKFLKKLRAQGVEVVDSLTTYDYGNFVHIRDLNGTKIELWEPVDDATQKYNEDAITK